MILPFLGKHTMLSRHFSRGTGMDKKCQKQSDAGWTKPRTTTLSKAVDKPCIISTTPCGAMMPEPRSSCLPRGKTLGRSQQPGAAPRSNLTSSSSKKDWVETASEIRSPKGSSRDSRVREDKVGEGTLRGGRGGGGGAL